MQRRALSACCLVALVVASTVAVAVPAAASTAAQPSAVSAETTNATTQADSEFNRTAFLAVDEAGDGDLVAGGITVDTNASDSRPVLSDATARLVRVDTDGTTEWSTRVESENATRVLDVVAADDGIYFILVESSPESTGLGSVDLRLGKATAAGEVRWQQPLNASVGFGPGAGNSLVETDDGVALTQQLPDGGVRLSEFSGETVAWERTYDVDAQVRSVRATEDGFLLAGSVGFDEPWVLRTTESGQPTFNETVPGIESSGVLGAVPTDDGGVVLAGQHRPGVSGGVAVWTAGIDSSGDVRWTRVHGAGSDIRFSRAFDREAGILLAGQNLGGPQDDSPVRLLGVGPDGAELFDETVEAGPRISAMTRSGDRLRVAGFGSVDPETRAPTSVLTDIEIPAANAGADASLEVDARLASNETVYQGQNARVSSTGPTDTYDLVRLPGEREGFEPRVVRRVSLGDDDTVTVETATLPRGEYVLRTPYGRAAVVEDGRVSGFAGRAEAAFRLESQRLFGVETNRTFVDTADGETGVAFSVDSDRSNYAVHVRADQYRGEAVGADELRAAFGGTDGFEGVDVVDSQPAARIEVGDSEQVRLDAAVGALGPGLYDVVVSGADTRDGGAVASGRVVVGTAEERPVGLGVANRSLSVAAGEEITTDVTLTGLTDGVGALALSANRTGDPDVRLRLRSEVDASSIRSGGSIAPEESATETVALDTNTSTGTVEAAKLRVAAESLGRDPVTNGTNTATLRVDWVVDESGVPYTLPDPVTVTYEVTGAKNTTDTRDGSGGAAAGGSGGAVGGGGAGSGTATDGHTAGQTG